MIGKKQFKWIFMIYFKYYKYFHDTFTCWERSSKIGVPISDICCHEHDTVLLLVELCQNVKILRKIVPKRLSGPGMGLPFSYKIILHKSSAVAEMGDRLAAIDMGRKSWGGAAVPLSVGENWGPI